MTSVDKASSPASIDTVPRPFLHSLVGFGGYWAAPEYTRKQVEQRGGRMVMELPFFPRLLLTARPEDCRAIFTERTGAVRFGEGLRRMAPHKMLFGTEMIDWWNGANHAVLRKKVSPAFNGKALACYEEAIVAAAQRRVTEWPVGQPVRFTSLMRTLARDVIMSVVFGVTESERRDRLEQQLRALDHTLASPGMAARYALAMARRGKWPSFEAMDKVNAAIDAVTLDEIAHRRANQSATERRDCLEAFLRIQEADDDDDMMNDRMIAIFQRLLLIAGYETTAVTLAWVAERIVRHPDVLAKLDATLAAGDTDYLDAVITETMRLRPSLGSTPRSPRRSWPRCNRRRCRPAWPPPSSSSTATTPRWVSGAARSSRYGMRPPAPSAATAPSTATTAWSPAA